MGCTTSHLVHNPTLILGSAPPRASSRAEKLRRNTKKRRLNLTERGDASSHVPIRFPSTRITSHFLVALIGAENQFLLAQTPSQHPARGYPGTKGKGERVLGMGHQKTAQGCARGAAEDQGRVVRAHRGRAQGAALLRKYTHVYKYKRMNT